MDIYQESDVGIGVVYEQFRLNMILERIVKEYEIKKAIEVPIYGMSGLTGINSMALVDFGVNVTLADKKEHIEIAKKAWQNAKREAKFLDMKNGKKFKENEFNFAYNFAALWYLEKPEQMIEQMCRTSKIVMICMPNPLNPFFLVRNLLGMLPKQKRWANSNTIKEELKINRFEIVESGIFDIPPWPDFVIPLKSFLPNSKKSKKWRWSMLDYYNGEKSIETKIKKLYFIEDSILPNFMKKLWAHHFYILAKKLD